MKKFISVLITLLMLASTTLGHQRLLRQPVTWLLPVFSAPA